VPFKARDFALVLSVCWGVAGGGACTRPEPPSPESSVEVMHWMTSGHDARALAAIRSEILAQGLRWKDAPMPGAGEAGRSAAVNRIVGGRPPDVFQYSGGFQLSELAAQGFIAPVPLDTSKWSEAFPPEIIAAVSQGGRYVGVPVDVRGENWMFYNPKVLRDAGIAVPATWDEFLVAAKRLRERGITPLAVGGQAWQERLLFNTVLLGVAGTDAYRDIYVRRDEQVIHSRTLGHVFEVFGALRAFVDVGSPGRRWSATTHMVTDGRAAFQIMGDWAKAEITASGGTPGRDIGCAFAPGTQDAYVGMVDVFAFPREDGARARRAQSAFAGAAFDAQVQDRYAMQLGALPARLASRAAGYDDCSMLALQGRRKGQTLLLDPGLSLPGKLSGAVDDAIDQFWNDPGMSAAAGQGLFVKAFETNR